MLDPLGKVLSALGSNQPMAEQAPEQTMSSFVGFSGFVDKVKFSNKLHEIPINVDEIRSSDCLYDIEMNVDGLNLETGYILNKGTEEGDIRFRRTNTVKEIMLFEMYPV